MELGPENHNGDGLLEPNSIVVVYMDPLNHHLGSQLLQLPSLSYDQKSRTQIKQELHLSIEARPKNSPPEIEDFQNYQSLKWVQYSYIATVVYPEIPF